ncbi:hypothetical protein [Nannocystis pusilla]|uniref:Uncharacterized protein n=1 Tax=Nannocystis pusilla TaxID=889268 RepID=A0ABS7U113_9BACT|nr:hypothetical protein [Nannocystis pusilla]MBZ5714040.1 hypothetical protein [Nannocystis pusilla]
MNHEQGAALPISLDRGGDPLFPSPSVPRLVSQRDGSRKIGEGRRMTGHEFCEKAIDERE